MLTRSYFVKIPQELNAGKRGSLLELLHEWQRTLPKAFDWYWAGFWKNGRFDTALKTSGPQASFPGTRLGVAHKDMMLRAVAGQAQGWTSNLQNKARQVIASAPPALLNAELRHALYWINSMKLWLVSNAEQNRLLQAQNQALDVKIQALLAAGKPLPKGHDITERLNVIPQAATRLLRHWLQHYVQRYRLPNPDRLPLCFSANAGKVQAPTGSTFEFFKGWINVTTLSLGKRLAIPFQGGRHIDHLLDKVGFNDRHKVTSNHVDKSSPPEGSASAFSSASSTVVLQKTFELHERKGDLYFKLVFKREADERWHDLDQERVPVLALDLGLRNFLASSEGDLRGVDFLDTLYRYDRKVQTIQKGLQNAGVKRLSECRRYRSAIEDVKGFLKTNVRTWLRSVLLAHEPRTVVVEDLAFTEALDPASGKKGLGKTLNRLVRGFGQRVFKEALQQWSEEYGFTIQEVEPAYTSQTCSHCGFVHAQNRSGNRFACSACGFKAHADVNAAKVQARRSGLPANVRSRTRHAWWSGSLKSWVLHLRTQLLIAQPGSPWFVSLVGRARQGVAKLLTCRTGAKAFLPSLRQRLEALLLASDAHLVTTIRRLGHAWQQDAFLPLALQVSTR